MLHRGAVWTHLGDDFAYNSLLSTEIAARTSPLLLPFPCLPLHPCRASPRELHETGFRQDGRPQHDKRVYKDLEQTSENPNLEVIWLVKFFIDWFSFSFLDWCLASFPIVSDSRLCFQTRRHWTSETSQKLSMKQSVGFIKHKCTDRALPEDRHTQLHFTVFLQS